MRDKNFDVDLLKTLNDQPMPETPLTDDEFTRVLDAACGRLPQKKPAGHRRFPWERVAAAAVACLAVGLGSINFAAPAVAEQLPVVGSLFSWLNRGGQDDYVSLQSEQLNKYAETVESTAETADSPYTLTLGQVFNDGDWLRISLMLTSEDDSLAGFNAIGPREDAVEKALQNGGGQYGTLVLDNGIELSGGINFEKRDDHTFVTGINYELFLTHDDLAGHTATLTLSDLVACNKSIVETDGKSYWHYDYADQTPLPGTYTLTFTIPEVSDAGAHDEHASGAGRCYAAKHQGHARCDKSAAELPSGAALGECEAVHRGWHGAGARARRGRLVGQRRLGSRPRRHGPPGTMHQGQL